MKKALLVASVASMIKGFNLRNIEILQSLGYRVEIATNFEYPGAITISESKKFQSDMESINVRCFQVDFPRGVGSFKENMTVLKQLKRLTVHEYEIVHCQSPIGGALGRISFKGKTGSIIYTAHGFHFFKGGPKINWILFYPFEKLLSKVTDVTLTINNEDTIVAKKFGNTKVYQLPGVGIDWNKYQLEVDTQEKTRIMSELGINKNAKVIISIGELNDRKNHITGIRALAKLADKNIYYLIFGVGNMLQHLKNVAKEFGIEENVIFMGYRSDIEKYLAISDLSIFLSKREGLGLAGLEAMAAGLPLISSNLNGIRDYTSDNVTGFTIDDVEDFNTVANCIVRILGFAPEKYSKISKNNRQIAKKYDISESDKIMKKVYSNCSKGD